MAITFDPANKVIQLDSFSASEREIWTAFVDWAVLSDNLKYGVGMTQIGGVAPIPLYIYLALGWRVRPKEASGTTTITGNLLTDEGDYPIVPTLGSFNAFINLETPVKGVLLDGGGITAGQLSSEFSSYGVSTFDPDSDVIENSLTHNDLMKIQSAALAGKVSGSPDGPILIKGVDGTTTRINATVDEDGNRTAVTLTP